ncbi:Hpt domain-containing protein [Chitinophaga sancti]|uniref:Hpt domain-containing protein n=1 Tax=Chitinophaga sancti TaxID=1004 RepID=A0A1K1NGX1_9BACT|nr:Hpt domain-containing protein [Chitinophaga sancti]WQD63288.1 Hpt domain-containing protein [Chitinophaga sancti]WQG91086.1 Hpt domain-containing protein [Chitinophaga sancti]SFW33654.1 Hpt domain-containing protein [Chitinophaga sancti]
MRADHALYSYNYLYKISGNSAFIHKMISLFINSVTEYADDLQLLQETKVLHDLKRTVHKLKPSVLSMEVMGAREIILKLEEKKNWDGELEELVAQLKGIFLQIRPMMEEDLKELKV